MAAQSAKIASVVALYLVVQLAALCATASLWATW